MAGFGGLGGLGGLAPSYPTRAGAPTSDVIQSDDEVSAMWARRMAGVPQDGTQIAANRDYTFAPAAQQAFLGSSETSGLTGNAAGMAAIEKFAREKGLSLWDGGSGLGVGVSAYGTDGSGTGSHLINTINGDTNPEWAAMRDERDAQLAQRGEDRTRAQQGYDYGMLGGKQLNGVMGENYSQPGFGQINGIMGNPYAPAGGASFAAGLYDPGQGTSGVYGGTSRKNWGLF